MTRGLVAAVLVAVLAGCSGGSSHTATGSACSKLVAAIQSLNHATAKDAARGHASAAAHEYEVAARKIRNATAHLAATNPVRAAADNLASQMDAASLTVTAEANGGHFSAPTVAPNGLQAVC